MKTSQTETEQRLSIRHTSHKNRLLIIGIVCSFILFVFYAFNSWRAADKDLEKGALAYAQTIEVALNTVRLEFLQANEGVESSDYYRIIKDKLIELRRMNPNTRTIYLLKQEEGKVIFLVDSEPANSIYYSSPGREYYDTDTAILKAFDRAEPVITDHHTDSLGKWKSVVVPLRSFRNSAVYALLGIDYDVNRWKKLVLAEASEDIIYAFAVVLLFVSLLLIMSKSNSLNKQEKLRQIAEQQAMALLHVVEQSDDIITVKDSDLRVFAANKAFARSAGYDDFTEVIGKTDAEIYNIPPWEEPVRTYMDDERRARSLKPGEYLLREEELITHTGERRTILTKKYPIYDTSGNVLFTSNISRDITERKKMEIELKNSKELAESASRAKSEFLSNMSHEIRTPLNGVIGFTELLSNTPLNKMQKEYLDNAIVSANSLLGIISDVLDFSKIEAGKLELDMVSTDVIRLVESAADIIKIQASHKDIELLLDVQPDLPRFMTLDPLRFKQVLVNLMNNAVKFTHAGEVELKLNFIRLDENKGQLTVSVRDTGIGIKEADKSKLFKAFSQADTSTTRRYGGTGLGLIISNSIVKKMGGEIQFESKIDEGSRFYFTLELNYDDDTTDVLSPIKDIKTVLFVDDNENNRLILERTFEYWGIEFTGCDSGLKAIKLLQSGKHFDLLIVDYHMPQLDGLETIKLLRKDERFAAGKLPVILLHSSSEHDTIHCAAKELNILYTLTKPVKAVELYYYLQKLQAGNGDTYEKYLQKLSRKEESSVRILENKLKIIITEDIKMNRVVIANILKSFLPNAELYEAVDGQEAIEMFKNVDPDLILMDVQLPVMDGLEATRRIRNSDNPRAKELPIVALTAGVSNQEKENCFLAGMNDFLPKPIEKEALFQVIIKNVIGPQKATYQTDDLLEPDVPHFDEDKLLEKIDHDTDLMKSLLEMAAEEYPKFLQQMKTACENKDACSVKSIAHTLKGSAYNLEMTAMGDIARKMEFHHEDPEVLLLLLESLEKEWKNVQNILEQKQ